MATNEIAFENYLIELNSTQNLSNNLLKDIKSISLESLRIITSNLTNVGSILLDQNKNSFLLERENEIDRKIQQDRNKLLEQLNKTTEDGNKEKSKESGGLGSASGLIGMLTSGLGAAFGLGIFKKLGFKGGLKVLGKGILKKIFYPIQAIISVFDFVKGFTNAKEITGGDSLLKKIQAGISSVLSGLTFGLLDPKTISKGIDFIIDGILDLFDSSIKYIKGLIKEYKIVEKLNARVSDITFGLFNFDDIVDYFGKIRDQIVFFIVDGIEKIKWLWNKLVAIKDIVANFVSENKEQILSILSFIGDIPGHIIGLILTPFNLIKDIFNGEFDLGKTIDDYISNISFGLFDLEKLKSTFETVKDRIMNFFKEPFEFIKSLVTDTSDFISELNPFKSDNVKHKLEKNRLLPDIKKEISLKERRNRQNKIEQPTQNNLVNTTNNNISSDIDMTTEIPIIRKGLTY